MSNTSEELEPLCACAETGLKGCRVCGPKGPNTPRVSRTNFDAIDVWCPKVELNTCALCEHCEGTPMYQS